MRSVEKKGAMRIAITGATGYIGSRLVFEALRGGHEVVALSRREVAWPGVVWKYFDLFDEASASLPDGLDAVFHLAAQTQTAHLSFEAELSAAKRLVEEARKLGAKLVFVSSQTSDPDSPTRYGRLKWEIEQLVLAGGGLVVRPGLVYGGPEKGLFGRLCFLVRTWPVLPALIPAVMVQPIHLDDLTRSLLLSLELPPGTVVKLGLPQGVSFTEFLRALARYRAHRCLFWVPVPKALVAGFLGLLGPAARRKLGLEQLLSLLKLKKMDTRADLDRLGVTLRPFPEGMNQSGSHRALLLREAKTLLSYVLRAQPQTALLRRYVRAAEIQDDTKPLPLPLTVHRFPALLGLLEGKWAMGPGFWAVLKRRLNAALLIAEASPQGSSRFLALGRDVSALRDLKVMASALTLEILRRGAQLVLYPVLRRVGRKERHDAGSRL